MTHVASERGLPRQAGDLVLNPNPQAKHSFDYRGYRLLSTLDETSTRALHDAILDNAFEVKTTFKDSRATYAAQLQIGDESFVYKIPRARLRRRGERFASLFRDGESIRTFENLQLMHQLGFQAPVPLLAGQQRRKGVVVDSFCCYRFVHGNAPRPEDAQAVTAALLKLHEKGYVRSDAKPANFLLSDAGVSFIDFRLKKPILFAKFKIMMELAHFVRIYPESIEFIPNTLHKTPGFALASWMERRGMDLRRARRRLRRAFKSSGS